MSAYDLYYDQLPFSALDASEVVFLDSGGYEARGVHEAFDSFRPDVAPQKWTLDNYLEMLDRASPSSKLVMVSYDFLPPCPVSEQIAACRELLPRYPHFAVDFLAKPSSSEIAFVAIDEVAEHIEDLRHFDVIGITEKELGATLKQRCSNLAQLRRALVASGLDVPIHVFGCIEPLTSLAYFLCGADIFDGLAWLRYEFAEIGPRYMRSAFVNSRLWSLSDDDASTLVRLENLSALRALTNNFVDLAKAVSSGDPNVLDRIPWTVQELLTTSGISIRGE